MLFGWLALVVILLRPLPPPPLLPPQVDLASGRVERRVEGVGDKAHGLVLWPGGGTSSASSAPTWGLMLDSDGGALVKVDLAAGGGGGGGGGGAAAAVERLWQVGRRKGG